MSLQFYYKTNLLPRLVALGKAVLKPPTYTNLSVSDFIASRGPSRIKHFVSIGANDGVKNDPLAKFVDLYGWKGVMVEPMPQNFQKLKENRQKNKNLILENVGITEEKGEFDFYHLTNIQPDEPDWYDQVSSFDKETFYKNISVEPALLERVGKSKVEGITFDMLVKKHGIQQIDLLMIDTEGYDYKILSTIDLSKISPSVIIFEYEWLTNYEFKAAMALLKRSGYKILINGIDCMAFK